MKETRVNSFRLCPNEFTYNRYICMYQAEIYIPTLHITDTVSIEVSNYLYSVNDYPSDGKLVICVPVKPVGVMNIKVTIYGG